MKILRFLLLAVIVVGCQSGQNIKKVDATLHSFYDAIESKDYQTLRDITTDDYKMIRTDRVWTIDSLINKLQQTKPAEKSIYELSEKEVTLEGSAAWITYRTDINPGTDTVSETGQWTETAVLREKGNEWKIALIQSTDYMPRPAQIAKRTRESPLEGGWEIAYGTYGIEDEPIKVTPPDGPNSLKVFCNEHFAYVLNDKDGSFLGAAAGSYEIRGDHYIERTEWSSVPENVGSKKIFNFHVEGDSLFISGPIEVIEADGEQREDFRKMEEVRVRASDN